MKQKTFGNRIAALRREKGMTQLDLAQKMGITDKAVSKWERDLAYPDVESLPRLAEIFGISVDALMQDEIPKRAAGQWEALMPLALTGIAMAMGIAVTVLSALKAIAPESAVGMLGIGLACLAINHLPQKG